jgi:hypothetical protein
MSRHTHDTDGDWQFLWFKSWQPLLAAPQNLAV